MLIRNQVRFVLAAALVSLVCCTAEKPVNVISNTSAAALKTTYWVVVMWTLIGTGYITGQTVGRIIRTRLLKIVAGNAI